MWYAVKVGVGVGVGVRVRVRITQIGASVKYLCWGVCTRIYLRINELHHMLFSA